MMMRRLALLLAPLLAACAVLAGCGSSPASSGASAAVTVTGPFGKVPKVKIPDARAGGNLQVRTLINGSGPTLPSSDALLGNYVVYIWDGSHHKLAQSTFGTTTPAWFTGRLLPGLATALKNTKEGSRVLAVVPPRYAYGSQGNSQGGVTGTDTLVFVIDVIKGYPKTASVSGKSISSGGNGLPAVTSGDPPSITIPKTGRPPSALVAKTLIQGSGPVITKGEYVVAQYVGVIWRTGKIFDSSYAAGSPFGFTIGASPTQVIPGWNTGLLGQRVGSRVMLVIPPKDGYGSAGSPTAGIKGTDTLVFVIDILGSFAPGTV